jgi:ABC-type methionine transport system ATPase subunit
MDDGRVVEQGTAREVFEHPRHARTVQFLQRVKR